MSTPESGGGLVIRPVFAGARWLHARTSPRLERELDGDFAVQVIISNVGKNLNTAGGILLMIDGANHLWLANGLFGCDDVSFGGTWESVPILLGRGTILSERKFLRIEKRSDIVRALCSADGKKWLDFGEGGFSAKEPAKIWLVGFGHNYIFQKDFDGSAIRFESCDIWRG